MTPAHLAVEATGLRKAFGTTRAVDGIDLSIPPGSIYGFLGPNGAGKTTTIRMLATLLRPDAGTARVFGHDVVREAAAVRDRISLTGQYASVDEGLTGRENLVLIGRLHGYSRAAAVARAADLLDVFGLTDIADKPAKTYSGGLRRRLDIAAGLIVTPDLLFLDEPTTGLDPRSRSEVWTMVRGLVHEGATVLLTTQYLDEADRLADRIGVIDHGSLIAEGTSSMLKASIGAGALHVRLSDPCITSGRPRPPYGDVGAGEDVSLLVIVLAGGLVNALAVGLAVGLAVLLVRSLPRRAAFRQGSGNTCTTWASWWACGDSQGGGVGAGEDVSHLHSGG